MNLKNGSLKEVERPRSAELEIAIATMSNRGPSRATLACSTCHRRQRRMVRQAGARQQKTEHVDLASLTILALAARSQ